MLNSCIECGKASYLFLQTKTMKIALAQINPTVGDFEKNYGKITCSIDKAKKVKADVVIFPELILCGYPPEDLLFKKSFLKANKTYLDKIKNYIKSDLLAIVGYVASKDNKVFNAAAFVTKGKILDTYYKIFLPNYGIFDEKRYFTPGNHIHLYSCPDFKISLTICEDIWNDDFFSRLKNKYKPNIIINISASPFFVEKLKIRKQLLSARARKAKCFVVYCNLVGAQDELVFDGSSVVVDPRGEVILEGKRFKEDLIIFDSDKQYKTKLMRTDAIEDIYNALILGIRDYTQKNGFEKVVIGVSGGIDSALTLVLAKEALGKENVIALIMPSRYTAKETLNDAMRVSKSLGVKLNIVPIEKIYASYIDELDPFIKDNKYYDLSCQNIQARIRGNILMSFSNRFGHLVLNTGNKSEISVGYCTLYGDMVGGFGVLKDVYKSKVYKLAEFINKKAKKEIIPFTILKRAPSAELKPDQKDEDDIPAYKILDKILKLYIEKDASKDAIIKRGFNKKLVEKVIGMVDKNEYKRRQSPPGIKITPKAFGKDRRMPITSKFSF